MLFQKMMPALFLTLTMLFETRLIPEIPLPKHPFIPGQGIHPKHNPKQTILDPVYDPLKFEQAFLFSIDLFNAGFYWEVHELLERFWKTEKNLKVKNFLQVMIQVAALTLKLNQRTQLGRTALVTSIQSKLNWLKDENFYEFNRFSLSAVERYLQLLKKEKFHPMRWTLIKI